MRIINIVLLLLLLLSLNDSKIRSKKKNNMSGSTGSKKSLETGKYSLQYLKVVLARNILLLR